MRDGIFSWTDDVLASDDTSRLAGLGCWRKKKEQVRQSKEALAIQPLSAKLRTAR